MADPPRPDEGAGGPAGGGGPPGPDAAPTGAAPARVFTAQQARAIEAREGPLLLVANAGSGKTSVLVERVVRTVLDDGVPLGEVLAITFTEKAAAQLSERVRSRLAELGHAELAGGVDDAQISTIHALCAAILRAGALRAGLDPAFTVLAGAEADRMAATAFRAAVDESVRERGEPAMDLLATYGPDVLRELVVDVHERLRSRGSREGELPPLPAHPDPAGARAPLAATAAALRAELAAVAEPTNGVVKALDLLDAADPLLAATADTVHDRLEVVTKKLPKAVATKLGDTALAHNAALDAYAQACFDHQNVGLYDELRTFVRTYARVFATAKRERSALDFTDLELGVDRLLDDPGIRDHWARRFRAVMVDEFQDTNPLQLRIVERLAPAGYFAVGDEFQSIYRFRHAAVELFRHRRTELQGIDRAWPLATNFRSAPELLHALNLAWAPLFGNSFVPLEPPSERERRGDTPTGGSERRSRVPEPAVELLITGKEGWGEVDLGEISTTATAWRLAEARLLAQRLVELGRAPRDMVVLVRATTDMAVYERALEQAGLPTYVVGGRGYWSQQAVQDVLAYLSVLANPRDELRIFELLASPMAGVRSDTLWLLADAGRRLDGGLWGALAALAEPGGTAGRTRGALSGPSGGGVPARSAADVLNGIAEDDRAKVRALLARLVEDRHAATRAPLAELIERAVSRTGFDLAILAMPGGERRMANVRKLQRLAREHEAAEGRDLRGFLDRATALTDEELGPDREGQAPVEGEDLDAVRIMTIHRAKGLEFPVVAVADLGREPRSIGHDLIRLGEDGAVGLKVPTLEDGRQPAFAYREIGDADARAEAEEERRLLYVAMTRAEERLILSGALRVEGNGVRDPLAWIAPAFVPDWRERLTTESPCAEISRTEGEWSARVFACLNTPFTGVLRDPSGRALSGSPDPVSAGEGEGTGRGSPGVFGGLRPSPTSFPGDPRRPSPPLPVAPAAALASELSYSALEVYRRCAYRFYVQRVIGLPDVAPPGGEEPSGGRERGVLVHERLARGDTAPTGDPIADRLIAAAATGPTAERLQQATALQREAPFSFPLDAQLTLSGAIDALARENETTTALVVDYKTDKVREDDDLAQRTEDHYATQRLVYALAVLESGANTVEVVHLYLDRPGDPVSRRYTGTDRPRLKQELSGLAAGLRAGTIEPAIEPHRGLCATCPAREGLCRHPEELTLREPGGMGPGPAQGQQTSLF